MRRVMAGVSGILFLVSLAWAANYKYVANSFSKKYHRPTCATAKNIAKNNLIKFKTAKEAVDAGYFSCQVCKPPQKD
jgi:methylphosphotriester-DNA--protein-cysteine methyltransferase